MPLRPMKQIHTTHSSEETEALARDLAKKLKPGDCLALCGDLGAGKTCFVHGLFEGLKGDPAYFVSSPTFAIMQIYPTQKGPLYHIDLYRLNSYADFQNLDFDEMIDREKGIVVIEWANKIPELESYFTCKILFESRKGDERKIEIVSS